MVHHPYAQTIEGNTKKVINEIHSHPSVVHLCCTGVANMDQIRPKMQLQAAVALTGGRKCVTSQRRVSLGSVRAKNISVSLHII